MKKLINYLNLAIVLTLFATACGDNDDSVKRQLLPSKIVRDGIPQLELVYDTDGRLIQLKNYMNGEFSDYTIYEYDDHGVKEARRYSVHNTFSLSSKTAFTLDDVGRIWKYESNFYQPGWVGESAVGSFDYDPTGRLVKRQLTYTGELPTIRFEFTYGSGDLYTELNRIYYPAQASEYRIKNEYTPGATPLYDHWKELMLLLQVAGEYQNVMDIFYTAGRETFFDHEGDIIYDNAITSGERQLNSQGYLVRQVLFYESNLDADDEGTSVEITYEYTE